MYSATNCWFPFAVAVDYSTTLFKLKHTGSDIILFDSSGNFISKFGKSLLKKEGTICWYHNVIVDDQENIYVTDILGNTIQKFKKVSSANP